MIKWIGVGLGTILGISHIGMIGYIATANKEEGLPKLDIPVTPYTSQAKAKAENYIWDKKTSNGWDVTAVNEG